jgi:hypothetical protein
MTSPHHEPLPPLVHRAVGNSQRFCLSPAGGEPCPQPVIPPLTPPPPALVRELLAVDPLPPPVPGVAFRGVSVIGNRYALRFRSIRDALPAAFLACAVSRTFRTIVTRWLFNFLAGLAVSVPGWRTDQAGATGLIARTVPALIPARRTAPGSGLGLFSATCQRRTKFSECRHRRCSENC